MKAVDLRAKTEDELTKELMALKKEQFNLRFQLSQGQLGNTAQIRKTRREVARIKTILAEKASDDVKRPAKTVKKAETKKAAPKKAAAKKTTAKKKEAAKKSDK